MRPLEALIAVVAALCALNVSAVNSFLDHCKEHLRENFPNYDDTEVSVDCGREMHGKDPLIWLSGNRTYFLFIHCLKQPAENYTCEDIPEFDFGHNDTIKEVSFLDCPMTFVSIACLERRLGVREVLKLTVNRPRGGFQWLREDMESLRGFRWISFYQKDHQEETITSEGLAPVSALERLDLEFIKPRLTPGAFAVLRALTHLQITFAFLRDSDLPPGVLANLPALTDLDLSRNNLEIITHDTFQNLTSLERLDLSGNNISSLDGAVLAAGCPRLRELKAQFNPLVELRPLEHLQHLEKLDISNCWRQKYQLELLPRALSALLQLAHIDMNSCKVHTLPADLLVGSKSLLTINLSNNQLSALPQSLFSDQRMLQELNLGYNKLETLPQEIFSSLVGLQRLDLRYNHLRALPARLFTNQRVLQDVNFSGNILETLPQEIFSSLVGLQRLDLRYNHLRVLPARLFTNQSVLQDVKFSGNKLEMLPQEIFSSLVGLQRLDLRYNHLRVLPARLFTNQSVLQDVNFSGNKLETLPQEIFSSLVGLQRLDLRHNYLRALPARLFTNQSVLQDVNFSENELETLPEDLFSVGLQHLKLENNLLKTLPEHFLKGLSVHTMDLSRNPLYCDCHLYDLVQRMSEPEDCRTLPRINVIANCIYPLSVYGRKLSDVHLYDLTC